VSCWRAKRHGCAIPTPNYIGSPPHPNEAADEYMYVVRTTLAPPPPALLAAPFRYPYFCTSNTTSTADDLPRGCKCYWNGHAAREGSAVRRGEKIFTTYFYPPSHPRSLLLSPPGAFSPAECSQMHPPKREQGSPSHQEVQGDLLGSDRAAAYGLPPRLDGVVAADPGGR
jgi:hypothetical protein